MQRSINAILLSIFNRSLLTTEEKNKLKDECYRYILGICIFKNVNVLLKNCSPITVAAFYELKNEVRFSYYLQTNLRRYIYCKLTKVQPDFSIEKDDIVFYDWILEKPEYKKAFLEKYTSFYKSEKKITEATKTEMVKSLRNDFHVNRYINTKLKYLWENSSVNTKEDIKQDMLVKVSRALPKFQFCDNEKYLYNVLKKTALRYLLTFNTINGLQKRNPVVKTDKGEFRKILIGADISDININIPIERDNFDLSDYNCYINSLIKNNIPYKIVKFIKILCGYEVNEAFENWILAKAEGLSNEKLVNMRDTSTYFKLAMNFLNVYKEEIFIHLDENLEPPKSKKIEKSKIKICNFFKIEDKFNFVTT